MGLIRTLAPAAVLLAAASAFGQCVNAVPGPDVIVGDIPDVSNYGAANGKRAYAIGTTSCNLGQVPLRWDDTTNLYPVISQNIYRLANGRFEQLGQAWLKHGFCALQGNVCCSCQPGGTCDDLYPGCSDPYGSGLNGSQGGLGPKNEIDAAAGYIPLNWTSTGVVEPGDTNQVIYKRLQAPQADLGNSGAIYFVSSMYIQPEDAEYGNDNNNQSYRRVTINPTSFAMTLNDVTQRTKPGIQAWRDHGLGVNQPDTSVQITTVLDPSVPPHNDSRIPGVADGGMFILGCKVTLVGSTYHYEYALQNFNNHRSGAAFTIPLPPGAVITNAHFKDVPYHSGEPYNGTDWNINIGASSIDFRCTETFAQNQNANALRWDTIYNFSFDCNVAPVNGTATIGLFRPASSTGPAALAIAAQVPNPNGGGPFVPPNDNCANASVASDGTTIFSTLNATTDGPNEPTSCNASGYTNIGNDIWYRWLATSTGTATVSTCGSSFDTKIGIYTGCPTGSNQVIACNDDSNTCGTNSVQSSLTFTATSGATYWIRIGGYASGTGAPATGNGTLTIVPPVVQPPPPPPAPANDDCATGAQWAAQGVVYTGDTTLATLDGTATCGSSGTTRDVWYRYRPVTSGTVTVSACGSSYDTVVSVRRVSCTGTQVACNDDFCGLSSQLTFPGTANTTYYIRVSGYNGLFGAYTLVINGGGGVVPPTPPANDNCANRVGIGLGATQFTTVAATTDGPTHALCNFFGNNNVTNDVWYNYPCFTTGNLTIDTCGSSFDSKLAVYANSGCTDFESRILGCSDNVCGLNPSVTIPVTAGQNYTIRVGGYNGATGTGTLNLTLVVPPTCPWGADNCIADYNNDDSIDGDDVIAFFNDWDANRLCADVNTDQGVDGDDVLAFFGFWDNGGVGTPGC
jgi:hypothetical protein